jgi:hypothetical protein
MLTLDALPKTLPPVRLARLEPHAVTLSDGRERVRIAMHSVTVDGRVLLEHVQAWDAAPMPVPPEAEAEIIEQIGAEAHEALQTLFAEELDWPPFWTTEDERASFLDWITPLFVAMDIPTDGLQTIREAEDAFVLMDDHLGPSLVDLAFLVFENEHFDDATGSATADGVLTGPIVLIDPETGRPVIRTERLIAESDDLTLDIEVVYGGPLLGLKAHNEEQGDDALQLSLPEGLFDAHQVLSLIPFLHLAENEPQTLYLFDLAGYQRVQGSNTGTFYTAHLEPRASRLSLSLEGRETLQSAEKDTPVLRVRATVLGSMPAPLGRLLVERPTLDEEGAQVFELLVRAEAPHHLLRIRVGDQELRGDHPESPAAVAEAAAEGS